MIDPQWLMLVIGVVQIIAIGMGTWMAKTLVSLSITVAVLVERVNTVTADIKRIQEQENKINATGNQSPIISGTGN